MREQMLPFVEQMAGTDKLSGKVAEAMTRDFDPGLSKRDYRMGRNLLCPDLHHRTSG